MRRLVCLLALLAVFGSGIALANTVQVVATGDCGQDLTNVRNAVQNAAAGDEVQLVPGGTNVFNLACAVNDIDVAIPVFTPDISITAPNGPVVLQGPGSADPNQASAIFVAANGFRMNGVTVQGWFYGVLVTTSNGAPVYNETITNSRFQDNIRSYQSANGATGNYLIGNTFVLPYPPSMDPTSPFALVWGVLVGDSNHTVISGNTVIGPGQLSQFTAVSQLVTSPSASQVPIHTVGIWQIDTIIPASRYSLISNNTLTNVDSGIQASSDYGVTSGNIVKHCAVGITISNDTDDGVTAAQHHIVTQNVSVDNNVGLWLASTQHSTASLNDFRDNSLAGIVLLANPGGAPSTEDRLILNLGSKNGVGEDHEDSMGFPGR